MHTKSFIVFFLITLSGCLSINAYNYPSFDLVNEESIATSTGNVYQVSLEVNYQVNGIAIEADNQDLFIIRQIVDNLAHFETNQNSKLRISVTLNLLADNLDSSLTSTVKGMVTGASLGLIGSRNNLKYDASIELHDHLNKPLSHNYTYNIHVDIGNTSPSLNGSVSRLPAVAYSHMLEDLILRFIKDMQDQGVLL